MLLTSKVCRIAFELCCDFLKNQVLRRLWITSNFFCCFFSELNLLPRPQTATSNHSGPRTSDLSIDKRKLSHFPFPPKIILVHNFSLDCAICHWIARLSLDYYAIFIGLRNYHWFITQFVIGLRNIAVFLQGRVSVVCSVHT